MQLRELLGGVDVVEWAGDPRVEVRAVTYDSRRARPGAVFCCVPGARADGHDYAADAVAAGAVALLVERRVRVPVAQAVVPSVRRAMGPASAAMAGHPSHGLRVLGVTGTNGKTTTVLLLEAIASAAGLRGASLGTLGTRVAGHLRPGDRTTPEAPDLQAALAALRDGGTQVVAMEVSSHALDQCRVDGTRFAAVGFTNLSHEHLDYHRTLDAYFDAKARLFGAAFTTAAAVNLDDPRGSELVVRARREGLDVRTFGIDDPAADLRAERIDLGAHGTAYALHDRRIDARAELRTPRLGRFNVLNDLGAASVALAGGLSFDAAAAGLEAEVEVPGRMERVAAGARAPFSVLVDYAHTPGGLALVLDCARGLATGHRLVVVFGAGGDRDRAKRPLMGEAVAARADLAIVTADNPRSEDPAAIAAEVTAGMAAGGAEVVVDLDRRSAIRRALAAARPGDVVVVAGKGHETGQTSGSVTVPFDDREVVREELETLPCS